MENIKRVPSFELPDEYVGYLLTQTYLLKQRVLNSALKELDITYMQFIILATTLELGEGKRGITQQTIASARQLDKVMVSNVVKTLVEKRYIKRFHHPVDHRALLVKLTSKGIAIATEAKKIVRRTDAVFFSGINNEELVATFKILLEKNRDK